MNAKDSRRAVQRALASGMVAAALLFSVACVTLAGRTVGDVFPGFFVDPYGYYSFVVLPGWPPPPRGVSHADRLAAVDGVPVESDARYGDYPSQRIVGVLRAARGRDVVRVAFERGDARSEHDVVRRTLGLREVWFFHVVYTVMALFTVWSGAVVFWHAGDRGGGRAYALWSLPAFAFLATFYDYHTGARLAPVFSLATLWVPVGFAALAYGFPEPPRRARWVARGALWAFTLGALCASAWTLLGATVGVNARPVRAAVDLLAPASMGLLALAILVRLRGSEGRNRAELLSAAWGLLALPPFVALAFAAMFATGNATFHLLLPFATLCVPLSIGYALVRHNILGTTEVLTRPFVTVSLGLLSLAVASFAWLIAAEVTRRLGRDHITPFVCALLVFAGLLVGGLRLSARHVFSAEQRFRPTVERLSDQLATLDRAEAVHGALVVVIKDSLKTTGARVVDDRTLGTVEHLPPGARAELAAGGRVWTAESPWSRRLLVPMRSLGDVRGVLVIEPKPGGALFTDEDVALLDTIAGFGAIALHNVETLRLLDELRRLQVAASRDDKRLTLAALGGVLHESKVPLNYLSRLLTRLARGDSVAPDRIETSREELARVERLISSLVRPDAPPRLARLPLRAAVRRTFDVLGDLFAEQGVTASEDVPEDLAVVAALDELIQLLANLLRNAAQAAGPGGAVGVCARAAGDGVTLDVWDTGPGVPDELRDSIWRPWVSARAGGMGLGLAVCVKIVQRFGWTIDYAREVDRTCFRVRATVPDVPEDPKDPLS